MDNQWRYKQLKNLKMVVPPHTPLQLNIYKQVTSKVRIGGTLQTYTTGTPGSGEYAVSGTTVTLGAAAPAGTGNVHIYRETDVNTAAAVFAAGSSIRAADLKCHS